MYQLLGIDIVYPQKSVEATARYNVAARVTEDLSQPSQGPLVLLHYVTCVTQHSHTSQGDRRPVSTLPGTLCTIAL